MKSITQLMEEMGFNKNAPMELQKAFIRHLVASARETAPTIAPKVELKTDVAEAQVQLEFVFPEDKRVS